MARRTKVFHDEPKGIQPSRQVKYTVVRANTNVYIVGMPSKSGSSSILYLTTPWHTPLLNNPESRCFYRC